MFRMASSYETWRAFPPRLLACVIALSFGCVDDAHEAGRGAPFADFAQVTSAQIGQDGGGHPGHPLDGGTRLDAGAAALPDASAHPEQVLCAADHPKFSPGMSARIGDLTVRLVAVDPSPPRQMVDNDWTIELVDARGAPLTGALVLSADTWMTVHDHGGRWEPIVEPLAGPGQFLLRGLDFKMRGPWLVRINVQPAPGARPLAARFAICVE